MVLCFTKFLTCIFFSPLWPVLITASWYCCEQARVVAQFTVHLIALRTRVYAKAGIYVSVFFSLFYSVTDARTF